MRLTVTELMFLTITAYMNNITNFCILYSTKSPLTLPAALLSDLRVLDFWQVLGSKSAFDSYSRRCTHEYQEYCIHNFAHQIFFLWLFKLIFTFFHTNNAPVRYFSTRPPWSSTNANFSFAAVSASSIMAIAYTVFNHKICFLLSLTI